MNFERRYLTCLETSFVISTMLTCFLVIALRGSGFVPTITPSTASGWMGFISAVAKHRSRNYESPVPPCYEAGRLSPFGFRC